MPILEMREMFRNLPTMAFLGFGLPTHKSKKKATVMSNTNQTQDRNRSDPAGKYKNGLVHDLVWEIGKFEH